MSFTVPCRGFDFSRSAKGLEWVRRWCYSCWCYASGGGEDCVVGDSIDVDIGKDGGLEDCVVDDDKVDGISVDAGGGDDCSDCKDDGICIDRGKDDGVGGKDSGVDNGKGDCSDGGVEVDKLIVDDSVFEELIIDNGTICTICTLDVVSSFSVSDYKTELNCLQVKL